MNTHKRMHTPRIGKSCLHSVVIVAAIGCAHAHCVRAEPFILPSSAPLLQRVLVETNKTYAIDYADRRGHDGRSLMVIDNARPRDQQIVTIFVFGRNTRLDAVTDKIFPPTEHDLRNALGYRWAIAGDNFFAGRPLNGDYDLLRIPMHDLVIETEETRKFHDIRITGLEKHDEPTMGIVGGGGRPAYARLNPVADIANWKGEPRLVPGLRTATTPREFHYDIRAIDDESIELYMTVDSDLSKWIFDGKNWQILKHYHLVVEGEFLVFDEGRSLIFERDGKWSTMRDIEKENATCDPIVDQVEGEPLTLVEDKVGQKTFFLHCDRLLDDAGRELFTAPASRDHTDRLRTVIDFVVSRRRPPP